MASDPQSTGQKRLARLRAKLAAELIHVLRQMAAGWKRGRQPGSRAKVEHAQNMYVKLREAARAE